MLEITVPDEKLYKGDDVAFKIVAKDTNGNRYVEQFPSFSITLSTVQDIENETLSVFVENALLCVFTFRSVISAPADVPFFQQGSLGSEVTTMPQIALKISQHYAITPYFSSVTAQNMTLTFVAQKNIAIAITSTVANTTTQTSYINNSEPINYKVKALLFVEKNYLQNDFELKGSFFNTLYNSECAFDFSKIFDRLPNTPPTNLFTTSFVKADNLRRFWVRIFEEAGSPVQPFSHENSEIHTASFGKNWVAGRSALYSVLNTIPQNRYTSADTPEWLIWVNLGASVAQVKLKIDYIANGTLVNYIIFPTIYEIAPGEIACFSLPIPFPSVADVIKASVYDTATGFPASPEHTLKIETPLKEEKYLAFRNRFGVWEYLRCAFAGEATASYKATKVAYNDTKNEIVEDIEKAVSNTMTYRTGILHPSKWNVVLAELVANNTIFQVDKVKGYIPLRIENTKMLLYDDNADSAFYEIVCTKIIENQNSIDTNFIEW